MIHELLTLVMAGRVVHLTVASFVGMYQCPEIVTVPLADVPPIRSGLLWRHGDVPPIGRTFIEIAASSTERCPAQPVA
jgi:hypothetical protein